MIGGLILATCATLMFVPVVFSMVHGEEGGNPQARIQKRSPDLGGAGVQPA